MTLNLTGENSGAEAGCADRGLEPMVRRASVCAKCVDHSSFKSDSSFFKEGSSTDKLLGVDTAEFTDWLKSTGLTTLT